MCIDVRKHGHWRPLDWLWLAPFVLIMSLWPSWRRRYWSGYVTTSVITSTIYTPDGQPPRPTLLAHEAKHLEQARRHGRARFALRYLLSQRWRIFYEAEAFTKQGVTAIWATDRLMEQYLITWPRQHVYQFVRGVMGR